MTRRAPAVLLALAAGLALAAAAPAGAAKLGGPGAPGAASREAAPDGFAQIPPLSGPVVDEVGALGPDARRRIEDLAVELEQKTGAEMAVLIVRSTKPE
jgi:uncharacterized protein